MLDVREAASDKGFRVLDVDATARLLDERLRKLSRQKSLCRRVLGALAAAFVKLHAHHRLGFARLGDYSRERLGLSVRELQSLARVSNGLDRLLLVGRAFERGEISWSQARLLVTVADDETEQRWLALACGKTVRALAATIREARRRAAVEVDEEEGRTIEGELRLPFRVACGRRVKQLWREVVALARQTAGEELPVWKAADLIAAEGWSALAGDVNLEPEAAPPARIAEAERPEPDAPADAFPIVDWNVIDETIPADVGALDPGNDPLDAFELDERMRAVLRILQPLDWQVGRLLRLFVDLRLHRVLGFDSLDRYVEERLGFSSRKARALVSLERKSQSVPVLADAYREGKISWLRALALLPVIGEVHGAAWTRRASEVTARRLNSEVEWALENREAQALATPAPPPPLGQRLPPPGRQTCARIDMERKDTEVSFSGPMSFSST